MFLKWPLFWMREEAEVLTSVFFTAGAPLDPVAASPVLSDPDPGSLIQDQQQDLLRQMVQKLSVFENQVGQV